MVNAANGQRAAILELVDRGAYDNENGNDGADSAWIFVSDATATTRFFNPEDESLYVDVATRTAITYRLPDGTTLVVPYA